MNIVRCNHCNWIGSENKLITIIYGDNNDDTYLEEFCPSCQKGDALMDVVYGCNFTVRERGVLADMLGSDGLVGKDKRLTERFLGWPVGTGLNEIISWFHRNLDRIEEEK